MDRYDEIEVYLVNPRKAYNKGKYLKSSMKKDGYKKDNKDDIKEIRCIQKAYSSSKGRCA